MTEFSVESEVKMLELGARLVRAFSKGDVVLFEGVVVNRIKHKPLFLAAFDNARKAHYFKVLRRDRLLEVQATVNTVYVYFPLLMDIVEYIYTNGVR